MTARLTRHPAPDRPELAALLSAAGKTEPVFPPGALHGELSARLEAVARLWRAADVRVARDHKALEASRAHRSTVRANMRAMALDAACLSAGEAVYVAIPDTLGDTRDTGTWHTGTVTGAHWTERGGQFVLWVRVRMKTAPYANRRHVVNVPLAHVVAANSIRGREIAERLEVASTWRPTTKRNTKPCTPC